MTDEIQEALDSTPPQADQEAPEVEIADDASVEKSDDEKMSEIYQRMTAEESTDERPRDENGRFVAKDAGEGDQPPEADEPDGEKAPDEEAKGDGDDVAPSYLPKDVRDAWKDIPKAARDSFSKSQQEMSAKLTEMGRRAQGFEPISDVVIRAAREFPELSGQTPQQIAENVFELAHTQANLNRDPVGTLLQVAQKLGVMDEVALKFTGQTQNGQAQNAPQDYRLQSIKMEQEIAELKQQLQQSKNQDNISEVVSQEISRRDTQREVSDFASGKEHWDAVEPALPQFIPAAQQIKGEGASNSDILSAAYDMAVNAYGLQATQPPPEKVGAKPDPRRTEAVIKAKSVNVSSTSTKTSPMSEDQAMSAVYRRMMNQ